jgi:hypothetical protein
MVGKAILLLLVGSLVALGWTKHSDRVREQDRLAVVASGIVGHKVGVRCPNFVKKLVYTRSEGGRVQFDENGRPANHTDLAPWTCDYLRHVTKVDFTCIAKASCGEREFGTAWAIKTLAHESFHMRGISLENAAECYGMQTTAQMAVKLGVPPRHAEQLQRWLWTTSYSHEPDEYTTPLCRNGGPLDLHPLSQSWP